MEATTLLAGTPGIDTLIGFSYPAYNTFIKSADTVAEGATTV